MPKATRKSHAFVDDKLVGAAPCEIASADVSRFRWPQMTGYDDVLGLYKWLYQQQNRVTLIHHGPSGSKTQAIGSRPFNVEISMPWMVGIPRHRQPKNADSNPATGQVLVRACLTLDTPGT